MDLYLECASGISGDMFAAAMLDLGADRDVLERTLASIPLKGFRAEISEVKKSAIRCCDFNVILDAEHENHDHDMEYLFGQKTTEEGATSGHEKSVEGDASSGGEEHHHAHHHHHEHRNLQDVMDILGKCEMTETARALAEKIFRILAEAEAKAHGSDLEHVHFHEVGAVDSIVDIVTAAVCFDNLNVRRVYIPSLFEGSGMVRCAHGLLPIPVPAVANIAAAHQLTLAISTDTKGEYVTPTGAAIAAAILTDRKLPERFTVRRIGLGAGKREYERPGILRAMLIDAEVGERVPESGQYDPEEICKLETNVDDCTGEVLGFTMERLFEAGALDVQFIPAYMKKNRPAWQLNVICTEKLSARMEEIIFRETTTIGIRKIPVSRVILPRRADTVQTAYGRIAVKECAYSGGRKVYPEYDSVAAAAAATGHSFRDVYYAAVDAALRGQNRESDS